MVFNWFRRQFGTSEESSEEASSENLQVEQEQQAPEQPDEEPTKDQSTEEGSPTVAEDYLSWAKAAYKNIQKQQQSEEAAPTDIEQVESISVDESATQPTSSEASGEEAATTARDTVTEEVSAPVEAVVTEPESDTTPEAKETATEDVTAQTDVAPAPEALPEPQFELASPESQEEATALEPETILAATEATPETVAPVSEEPTAVESVALSAADSAVPSAPVETKEASAASIPIWARGSERQERLERLKATALETPEPEPVRAAVQPIESAATTTAEVEQVAGFAFDEGFIWSAEVLAAQGRRPEDVSIEEISWLKRLRQGLSKTRRSLINQLKAIVGQGPLNQDAVMEIEALLLQADVGVEATDYIISTLQQKLREELLPPEQAIAYLKKILRDLLDKPCQESYNPTFIPEKDTLNIWLMTGVNGVGKTTTIGKLAHLANKSGYQCLIGAADTFRAAAVEQVKIWGERSGTEVIANPGKNTDPAAVVFDAIAAAQARNTELLLVDTAGRLQNKKNLMEELAKIRKIVDKKAPNAKIESLLVLDATLGQNGLRQAEVFSEAAKLSGVVLTKLDGTAKGGVALAVVQQLGLPIRFIGAGEGIEDLRPFSSYEFVEALISG
jgi:fused signal recognition particle receptor